ncbi:MAG: hypothetical protein AB1567_07810 [bacterium]
MIKRGDIPEVTEMIKCFNPKAFYSIEEVHSASEGIFPTHRTTLSKFMKFEKEGK